MSQFNIFGEWFQNRIALQPLFEGLNMFNFIKVHESSLLCDKRNCFGIFITPTAVILWGFFCLQL